MITIDKTGVYNIENAARGARNALNSWDRSDSYTDEKGSFILGNADLGLLKKLCVAGESHRKFLRQIFVSADITAPLYWWKEYDTYKVGTTANSQSTMHKIHSKPFLTDDFSHDKLSAKGIECLESLIERLEALRTEYNETKNKALWYEIIQLLPSSYNQMRTCTMSYENLVNMYNNRKDHKLDEWRALCKWITTLPYFSELII